MKRYPNISYFKHYRLLNLLYFRYHYDRGWQIWSHHYNMWIKCFINEDSILSQPSKLNRILEYEDTWCEPQLEDVTSLYIGVK